jgi:twitching motility protein PilI
MSKRISLREFQENLAHRLAEAQTGERRGLLGVQAGNANWLLSLPDAGEIITPPTLAPVPLTHDWYRGLVNVRGILYSVVDLSRFHDRSTAVSPSPAAAAHARLLLVGARQGVHSAILVSRVMGLRNEEDFEPDSKPGLTPDSGATDAESGSESNANAETEAGDQGEPRPWVAARLRDAHDHLWLRLDVGQLLANSIFLDAGVR